MRILITGATGFIGRELVRSFPNKAEITCLIRKESDFLKKLNISAVKCDLTDKETLMNCIKGFDTVIHLAGIVNTPSKKEFKEKNVTITKNLLDACKAANIKKFVFTSTAVVVSKVQGPYSQSKIEAEQLIKKSGIDYIILRPSVVYGEEDTKNLAGIVKIIKKFPIIPIIGSGRQEVQPVYIKDVAKVLIKAATAGIKNKTYFVAGPSTISFEQIIDLVAKRLNKHPFKIHIPAFIPIFLVKIYERIVPKPVIVNEQMARLVTDKTYNIDKTKHDLNFNPISIEEGISSVIQQKPL